MTYLAALKAREIALARFEEVLSRRKAFTAALPMFNNRDHPTRFAGELNKRAREIATRINGEFSKAVHALAAAQTVLDEETPPR